ncbi:MAG: ABC transporter permease [Bacteroidales bacterium]
MIKKLIKQMWNSKRSNGWIFAELLIVFIATWFVIDPLYTLLYQTKAFSLGCDPHNVYCMNIGITTPNETMWNKEASSNDNILKDYNTMFELVKNYKNICAAAPGKNDFWSGSYTNSSYKSLQDTTKIAEFQVLDYFYGTNYFNVFRLKNAKTKRWNDMDSISYIVNGVFITQNAEEKLFGKGKGIGKELCYSRGGNVKFKVIGILENFKGRPTDQPSPIMIRQQPNFMYDDSATNFSYVIKNRSACIMFRIADNVNENDFLTEFKRELMPKLATGNLFVSDLTSLEFLYKISLYYEGIPVTLKLHIVLTIFFMINICLAVFATFWFRIKKRRSEIGLMMVMGSTKIGMRNYFIIESLLIYGAAIFIGVIILMQIIYYKGLYSFGLVSDVLFTSAFGAGWPINNYFAHFMIVTILTTLVVGSTVLFGTWLSVRKAAKIEPADALREE